MSEYYANAVDLGFMPVEFVRLRILAFMGDNAIPVYDNKKVNELLANKSYVCNISWCWRPLRTKDVITEFSWGVEGEEDNAKYEDGYYSSESWADCPPCEFLVPKSALDIVAKLEKAIPGNVKFFVSDYIIEDDYENGVERFIMVRPTGDEEPDGKEYNIVFGYWNSKKLNFTS